MALPVQSHVTDQIIKNQIDLERYAEGLKNKVVSILQGAQEEIVKALMANDPTLKPLTEWKRKRLENLNAQIGEILGAGYSQIDTVTKKELATLAIFQQDQTVASTKRVFGVNLFDVKLTSENLKSISENTLIEGQVIGKWWQGKPAEYQAKFAQSMAQGMQQIELGLVKGESVGELIKRIRGNSTTPGVMAGSKREAAALVRTSVMQVANAVRQAIYTENEDVIKGYQVVATLDNRTTPLCRGLDGRQYDLDRQPLDGGDPLPIGPPFHWNCRSTLIPVFKSYEELSKGKGKISKEKQAALEDMSAGTRASMNGQVPASLDYSSWLKTQSVDTQKDILGPTRWQLWSDDKLSLADMVHQDGRPLTIPQLEQKVALYDEQKAAELILKEIKNNLADLALVNEFIPGQVLPEALFKPIEETALKYEVKPMELPSMAPKAGKKVSSGVITFEPETGKVWIYEPKNHFGGYEHTFPKGTVEGAQTLQKAAIREVWEETGLQTKVVGYLGDYEKTTSTTRYYVGIRTGGSPSAMGWEAQSVKLVPQDQLEKYLNTAVDKGIADHFIDQYKLALELGEGDAVKGFEMIVDEVKNKKLFTSIKEQYLPDYPHTESIIKTLEKAPGNWASKVAKLQEELDISAKFKIIAWEGDTLSAEWELLQEAKKTWPKPIDQVQEVLKQKADLGKMAEAYFKDVDPISDKGKALAKLTKNQTLKPTMDLVKQMNLVESEINLQFKAKGDLLVKVESDQKLTQAYNEMQKNPFFEQADWTAKTNMFEANVETYQDALKEYAALEKENFFPGAYDDMYLEKYVETWDDMTVIQKIGPLKDQINKYNAADLWKKNLPNTVPGWGQGETLAEITIKEMKGKNVLEQFEQYQKYYNDLDKKWTKALSDYIEVLKQPGNEDLVKYIKNDPEWVTVKEADPFKQYSWTMKKEDEIKAVFKALADNPDLKATWDELAKATPNFDKFTAQNNLDLAKAVQTNKKTLFKIDDLPEAQTTAGKKAIKAIEENYPDWKTKTAITQKDLFEIAYSKIQEQDLQAYKALKADNPGVWQYWTKKVDPDALAPSDKLEKFQAWLKAEGKAGKELQDLANIQKDAFGKFVDSTPNEEWAKYTTQDKLNKFKEYLGIPTGPPTKAMAQDMAKNTISSWDFMTPAAQNAQVEKIYKKLTQEWAEKEVQAAGGTIIPSEAAAEPMTWTKLSAAGNKVPAEWEEFQASLTADDLVGPAGVNIAEKNYKKFQEFLGNKFIDVANKNLDVFDTWKNEIPAHWPIEDKLKSLQEAIKMHETIAAEEVAGAKITTSEMADYIGTHEDEYKNWTKTLTYGHPMGTPDEQYKAFQDYLKDQYLALKEANPGLWKKWEKDFFHNSYSWGESYDSFKYYLSLQAGAVEAAAAGLQEAAALTGEAAAEPTLVSLGGKAYDLKDPGQKAAFKKIQKDAVYKYKKNALAGKPTTPFQNEAVSLLSQDKQDILKLTIEKESGHFTAATIAAPVEEVLPVQGDSINFTDYIKYKGQKGSNTGGFYKHKNNPADRWYIKTPASEDIARNEVLASKLYARAGVEVPELSFTTVDGQVSVASRLVDGIEENQSALTSGAVRVGVHDNFAVDAWLADWDVVGQSYDNLVIKAGRGVRIDVGGSLRYRAQGGLKSTEDFGPRIQEFESMRDARKNRQTASVFKLTSKDDMIAGARKVLAIPDEDIRALVRQYGPLDRVEAEKLADTLIARKKHLAELFPEAVPKSTGPAPLPAESATRITKTEIKKVQDARINGYHIPIDADQIEDQAALFHIQKSQDGRNHIMATLKVREDGAKVMNNWIKSVTSEQVQTQMVAGIDVHVQAGQGIYDTLRGIGMQSRGNEALRAKDIERIKAAKDEYGKLRNQIRAGESAGKYAKGSLEALENHFKPWIKILDEAEARGAGQVYKWGKDSTWKNDWTNHPFLKEIEKKVAEVKPKETGIKFKKMAGKFEAKTIKNGFAQETGGSIYLEDHGSEIYEQFYETTVDGVRVRYWSDATETSFAHRGKVEILTEGTTESDAAKIHDVMEKLGLNADRPSALLQEEMYLSKVFYSWRDWPVYDKVMADAAKIRGLEDRVKFLRNELNTRAGWNVTAGPNYRPEGVRQAYESGRIVYYRPDIKPEVWANWKKKYGIYHSNTNGDLISSIDKILGNGGQMAASTDKLRRGFTWSGMSPVSDMHSGGGSYVFTRLRPLSSCNSTYGLVWDSDELLRLDSVAWDHDAYGRTRDNNIRKKAIGTKPGDAKGYERAASGSMGGGSELDFKESLSLFDGKLRINVGSASDKARLIEVFKKHRYNAWPDGRRLEDVIFVV